MSKPKQQLSIILAVVTLALGPIRLHAAGSSGHIVIGPNASAMEQYAARELQRYLYQLSGAFLAIETAKPDGKLSGRVFLLGTRASNPLIAKLAEEGQFVISGSDPGPQGYMLKKVAQASRRPNPTETLVIAGSDAVGCLYGVYGLLEDYYGIGFYLGGDVLPDKKTPLKLPDVDERKKPAVAIRGFLPWTNFPQSATSYSWQDWKFILDQMAKMRMNFLHIHNYNGEAGHNEMFHNVTHDRIPPRVWMATARAVIEALAAPASGSSGLAAPIPVTAPPADLRRPGASTSVEPADAAGRRARRSSAAARASGRAPTGCSPPRPRSGSSARRAGRATRRPARRPRECSPRRSRSRRSAGG